MIYPTSWWEMKYSVREELSICMKFGDLFIGRVFFFVMSFTPGLLLKLEDIMKKKMRSVLAQLKLHVLIPFEPNLKVISEKLNYKSWIHSGFVQL